MADTITILNGLEHAQDTDDTATLFDVADPIESVVWTRPIPIPVSASQCRVIFRQPASGARVMCRVRMTKVTSRTIPTKTETQVLEWNEMTLNQTVETDSIDVSDSFGTILHIDCCVTETDTSTGFRVVVEIASEAGVDDAWTTVVDIIAFSLNNVAVAAVLPGNVAAGLTVIGITNPVATGVDDDGKFKFIRNDTLANSEIVYQVSNSGDV